MARHKKPALLRALEGNRGSRPIPKDELVGVGRPVPPSTLTPEQRERWNDVVGSLPDGLLSRADELTLERVAIAWAAFRETTAVINRDGLFRTGQKGELVRHPALLVRAEAVREMHVCMMALGLSPLARTRLTNPDSKSDDPLAMLMGAESAAWGKDTSKTQ